MEKVYAHGHGHVGVTLQRVDSTDLAFAGAAEQARLLAAGSITAPALLDLYLERIARLDPELRAYRVVLADSARQEAAAAQARLDAGERLPLLGVPIAIKDDVDIAGEVTTYGTAAHGPAKTADAEVVRRLRAAGAIILGKTAVPEMMLWSFTETVEFGATRNPWNTDYTPGAAAAAAARRSRRVWRRWRWVPTAWDPSAFRRLGAACSGSSRSGTECRWRRTTAHGTA